MKVFNLAEELEKERKKVKELKADLKEANESITWWTNRFNAVERENNRLNNIIDELEKWLQENIGICRTNINYTTNQIFNLKEDTYYRCLNKLKELKGDNK